MTTAQKLLPVLGKYRNTYLNGKTVELTKAIKESIKIFDASAAHTLQTWLRTPSLREGHQLVDRIALYEQTLRRLSQNLILASLMRPTYT